jgi:hypothetical protein
MGRKQGSSPDTGVSQGHCLCFSDRWNYPHDSAPRPAISQGQMTFEGDAALVVAFQQRFQGG